MTMNKLRYITAIVAVLFAACSDSNDDDDDDTPGDEPSTGVTTPITNSGYGKYPHGWDGTLTRTTADGKIAGLPNDLSDQWGQGETDTWDGTTDISWYGPSPLQAYHIKTAEQLAGLGVLTAMGITFEGETIKLDVNIILNERIETDEYYTVLNPGDLKQWTPIENFYGTFDGCGHVISGLYINSQKDFQALFGTSEENRYDNPREVWNLGIVNSYVKGGEASASILGDFTGDCLCCFSTGIVVSDNGASSVGGNVGAFCFNKGVIIADGYIETLSPDMYYSYNAGILIMDSFVEGLYAQHNFYNLYLHKTQALDFGYDYCYSIFEEGMPEVLDVAATFKDNSGTLTIEEGSKIPGNATTLIDALNNYELSKYDFKYPRPDIVWKVDPERNNGYPIFTQDIYTGK